MVMSTFLYGIQPEDNFYTFPSSLLQFCVESFNTCFSSGANGYCVPVGLTALSALLLLLSCVRSVCQRSQRPGHAFTSTYCFLGELCGAVGAVLSKQLQIQVFMGIFSLLVSAANMIFGCFPVFLCWNTLAERKRRMKRRRRRQLLLATCVFTVVSGGYLMSGFTSQRAETHFRGRGLLYIDLQDNSEILGYILGLLCFFITSSSRFPALYTAHKGQTLPKSPVLTRGLCSLAAALYATAILLHNSSPGLVLRALPWLLSAVGTAALDLLFVLIFWCKQGTLQEPMRDGDTISLLGTSVVITKRKFATKMKMTPLSNLPVNTKSTEMGGYLDVDSKSALQKEAHHHPPVRTVRSINLDGLCASDTSWESSDDSSDLQWDFEQINTTWNNKKREQGREPSKECTDDLKPSSSCQYEVPLNPQMVV
ncbi:transmembrane protein 44 isoform X1 [Synchiropus splendidus]|uniref:transmembrane protein 44 isoform X1 n=2 Tax=Synchiropus splendidus TaxID=270530 RepID=UPI00237ED888|nr:transmembrane protein 44 isoform X1 [Synchiropus splendidus]